MQKGNVILGLLIGAVIALIPSYVFYSKYQTAQKQLKNPQAIQDELVKGTVSKLGQLMILPKDDKPTVLTVSDKTKLKSQPFFAKAENGDKVIIFINTRKAVLYREKDNRIIEVAPVNIEKGETATPSATTTSPTPATRSTSPSPSPANNQ